MTRRRFIVGKFGAERTILTGEQAHHLAHVLRARPGQLYELSNQQTLWLARIVSVSSERVEFELVESVSVPPSPPRLVLLASIIKFSRLERFLEKATELGVSEILLVNAKRSDRRLIRAAVGRGRRWEKILRAAAQQARRVDMPRLGQLLKLSDAVSTVDCEARILLSEASDAVPLRCLLRSGSPPRSAALAVGPEGGWTDEERQAAHQRGFVEASLGSEILRTETAVVSALAILHYELAID